MATAQYPEVIQHDRITLELSLYKYTYAYTYMPYKSITPAKFLDKEQVVILYNLCRGDIKD